MLAKTVRKIQTRICHYCGMDFIGSQFQRFCTHPNCVSLRKEALKEGQVVMKDPDADNRFISKKRITVLLTKKHIAFGHCCAKDSTGKMCGKSITLLLEQISY